MGKPLQLTTVEQLVGFSTKTKDGVVKLAQKAISHVYVEEKSSTPPRTRTAYWQCSTHNSDFYATTNSQLDSKTKKMPLLG